MSDNYEQRSPDFNKNPDPAGGQEQAGQNPYQAPQPQYGYPQQGYQQGYPQQGYNAYPPQFQEKNEGQKRVDLALILGILGFFFMPLILGVIALMVAKQGEELGADARIATIISWVDIIMGALGALFIAMFFLLMFV